MVQDDTVVKMKKEDLLVLSKRQEIIEHDVGVLIIEAQRNRGLKDNEISDLVDSIADCMYRNYGVDAPMLKDILSSDIIYHLTSKHLRVDVKPELPPYQLLNKNKKP